MPIYEYRCSQCGTEKEYLQKLSDAPITDCPACGNATMVKLVSPAGFQLKGTGWYATDFKQGNKRKPADVGKSEGGGKSEGAEKGEGAKADSAEGTGKSEAAPACGAGACPACQ